MQKNSLTPEVLMKLVGLFTKKNWKIEESNENTVSLFNRFCFILSDLLIEEQLLILELTDRFTKVELYDYEYHYKSILDKLIVKDSNILSNIKKIYITPLIAPKDVGKSKSSTFVFYLFKSLFDYLPKYKDKLIYFVEDTMINDKDINCSDCIVFAVDDFIGTGETAKEALEYLHEVKKIKKENIIVLAVAAMNQGKNTIFEFGVNIFSSIEISRGISEFYAEQLIHQKISLMSDIELRLKVHENEKFGYRGSEALISLHRTPNNTFPVFWKKTKGRLAPFPR